MTIRFFGMRSGCCWILLDQEPDFEVVAEAEDGTEVIDLLKKHQPDILLLDLMMPQLDGLSVLQRIPSYSQETKTIVLTVTEDEKAFILAMKYGASGIVEKNKATEFLVEGIRRVQKGEIFVDDKMMVLLMKQFSSPCKAPPSLSGREKEVVSLVCEGLRNKEIADRLFVSEETVKTHLHNIFEKTGVSDRMHLVLLRCRIQPVPEIRRFACSVKPGTPDGAIGNRYDIVA